MQAPGGQPGPPRAGCPPTASTTWDLTLCSGRTSVPARSRPCSCCQLCLRCPLYHLPPTATSLPTVPLPPDWCRLCGSESSNLGPPAWQVPQLGHPPAWHLLVLQGMWPCFYRLGTRVSQRPPGLPQIPQLVFAWQEASLNTQPGFCSHGPGCRSGNKWRL